MTNFHTFSGATCCTTLQSSQSICFGVQGHPKSFSIRSHPWTPQLHKTPVCTTGLRGPIPRQTQKTMILGRPLTCQVQHWHINATPPLFQNLYCANKGNKGQWHNVLLIPIYNKRTSLVRNTCHPSGTRTHQRHQRNHFQGNRNRQSVNKGKQTICKNSIGEGSHGKGQGTVKQTAHSLGRTPSCTTFKGGQHPPGTSHHAGSQKPNQWIIVM